MLRLGVDIGGTFTDFVLVDDAAERAWFGKTLTTPHDPAEAIVTGMQQVAVEAGVSLADIGTVVHGTTLVTNAIIERKGARTALLATQGFRDLLEIGRELRYDIYDLQLDMPRPLVPRRWCVDVPERLDAQGRVVTPLDLATLDARVTALVADGVEAIAICFLHAFVNPVHEQQAAAHVKARWPQLALSCSSDVLPEIREYERATATVMNAYVQPLADAYLGGLARRLAAIGSTGTIHIMLSSGRLTTIDGARGAPVHLLESGPAGGAMAGVHVCHATQRPDVLTFDMGGTTAKASLIRQFTPQITTHFEAARVRRFKKGSGLPVRVPVIDMIEIGAGGGSIAWLDALGLLRVGPESASAVPGPACYGRGGTHPTVTDADLVLGYLDPSYFLGGRMALDANAARQAIDRHIATPLGIDVEEAALGIHRVVNESMANAARVHIIEKGHDPRRFAMLAFGGAGPVHAFQVARRLHLRECLIPVGAGVASAFGFLAAPIARELVWSAVTRLDQCDWRATSDRLARMEQDGMAFLADAGVPAAERRAARTADMRYLGQGHDISVPVPAGALTEDTAETIRRAFEEEYVRTFGRLVANMPLQVVTWRTVVRGATPAMAARPDAPDATTVTAKGTRSVRFPELASRVETPVYARAGLTPGTVIVGPALIEEAESTVVIGPRATVTVDVTGTLRVALHAAAPDVVADAATLAGALA
jgi:N-methylhydantoinase A/oxoprolinase/acetone carboxylase beta subunit